MFEALIRKQSLQTTYAGRPTYTKARSLLLNLLSAQANEINRKAVWFSKISDRWVSYQFREWQSSDADNRFLARHQEWTLVTRAFIRHLGTYGVRPDWMSGAWSTSPCGQLLSSDSNLAGHLIDRHPASWNKSLMVKLANEDCGECG